MRSARVLVGIVILGLAITLVFFLQRHRDDPVASVAAESKPQTIDATRTSQRVEPDAPSAASNAASDDEAQMQCAHTIHDAANFAASEGNVPPVDGEESDSDRLVLEQELAAALRKLADSADPEQFLAAMLLESPERRNSNDAAVQTKLLDLAERAIKSGSKVLAFHALSACAAAKPCPITHLEQSLLELDRQNAEAWALVATLWYQRGDVARALVAMQAAAHAPTSTWYWTETISMVERSLAAQSTMTFRNRMGSSFGAGASSLPPLDSFKMCKVESASSRAWAEACLALGKLRTERNETDSARSIGHSMRVQALTALGDRVGAAQAAAELASTRAERSAIAERPAMSMQMLQWDLIEAAPTRMQSYLGAVQEFGEVAGRLVFLRQEVPPLLERSGLLKRDGAKECVAQFFGSRRATAGQPARIGDELYISMSDTSGNPGPATVRIRPDGKITLPWVPRTNAGGGTAVQSEREIEAAGKTTEQLQREITAMIAGRYPSALVFVNLFSAESPEELQREFDKARKEATGKRNNTH